MQAKAILIDTFAGEGQEVLVPTSQRDYDRILQTLKWLLLTFWIWWASVPMMVQGLILMQILDTIGGLLVAGQGKRNTRISSKEFAKGWRRKAYVWILVGAVAALQQAAGLTAYVVLTEEIALTPAELLMGAFSFMEVISLAEKGILLGVKVPSWLVSALAEGNKRFGGNDGKPD